MADEEEKALAPIAAQFEKPLSPTQAAGVKALQRARSKAMRKTQRLLERGIVDAASIDDYGNPVEEGAPELRGRRRRIALDLREPVRAMKSYLKLAAGLVSDEKKIEAAQAVANPTPINIGTIVHVAPAQYEPIDVTHTKIEE